MQINDRSTGLFSVPVLPDDFLFMTGADARQRSFYCGDIIARFIRNRVRIKCWFREIGRSWPGDQQNDKDKKDKEKDLESTAQQCSRLECGLS
jgi:hypothetical protein